MKLDPQIVIEVLRHSDRTGVAPDSIVARRYTLRIQGEPGITPKWIMVIDDFVFDDATKARAWVQRTYPDHDKYPRSDDDHFSIVERWRNFRERQMYYNRKGERIELLEWAKLSGDESYKTIAEEAVGQHLVRTIWLGLDPYDGGDPLPLFGTAIGPLSGAQIVGDRLRREWKEVQTYSTEADAVRGHAEVVAEQKLKIQ